jgi:hypothetical protein
MNITTFDYVPKIILGKTSNRTYNAINLIVRGIAFFIYFKTNTEIDILEIIIAYIFPLIYIFYKISQTSSDYILGLFRLTGVGERCIERRGAENGERKSGSNKSISGDSEKCSEVDMNTINAQTECNNVKSVGDPSDPRYPLGAPACLYISEEEDYEEVTQRINCGIHARENTCTREKDNSNNDYCRWVQYGDQANVARCTADGKSSGIIGSISQINDVAKCPASCNWEAGAAAGVQCLATGTATAPVGTARGTCLDN